MDRQALVGLAALGVVGVGLIAAARNRREGTSTQPASPAAFGPDLGGMGADYGATGTVYDPLTGSYYDASNPGPAVGVDGLPIGGAEPYGPTFSPAYEAAALDEQRRYNDRELEEQRRANDAYNQDAAEASKYAATADLASIGVSALWGAGALAGLGSVLARRGAATARGGAGAVARGGQAAINTTANATRTSRLGAAVSRTGTFLRTPITQVGTRAALGTVAAGAALGVAGTAALEKTGQLDRVAKTGDRLKANLSTRQERVVKSVAAATLAPAGAVAAGLAGRGSVGSNLRKAYRGTYQEQAVKATGRAINDARQATDKAVNKAAAKTAKAVGKSRRFLRRRF